MLNAALGVNVPSAIVDGFGTGTGTSFAGPIVAGEIAALWALSAEKGKLPPSLLTKIANIGRLDPELAGLMHSPPMQADGGRAWGALSKLLGLVPLVVEIVQGTELPEVRILVQEPLDQFPGIDFTAELKADGQPSIIRNVRARGVTLSFDGIYGMPHNVVTVMAQGYPLFTISLNQPRPADSKNSGRGGW
jgi:hypothetical protein